MNGINANGLGAANTRPQQAPPTRAEQKPAAQTRVVQNALTKPVAKPIEDPNTLPLEAPEGTDPAFWSVLTAEERAFFARVQSLGPLTYHPRAAAKTPGVARGGRIDLTV